MTIESLPYDTKLVDPVMFDVSIYPVRALVTTDGVQYATAITNQTAGYLDASDYSFDTDTYFPYLKGNLAWVYVKFSFILWAGTDDPTVKWILQARNRNGTWTNMSSEESQVIAAQNSEATALAESLEGYLSLASAINTVPFSIRLRVKSDSTAANDKVSMRLKNDTVIRIVGARETR